MEPIFDFSFRDFFTAERIRLIIRIAVTLAVGLSAFRLLAALAAKFSKRRFSSQAAMIVRKAVFYIGIGVVFIVVLRQIGLNLAALLGAAGIVGIAVGFAAQTSVSNLISGLFLISEKPFTVGEVISVAGTTGIVISIDLLSVKLRTFDNQYVRMPSQQILNSTLTNISRFPIRRMDINIGVSYRADLGRVHEVLLDIAERNPLSLEEPAPLFIINRFGDSAVEILFGVWFEANDFLGLKNSIMIEIKERFDLEGIEIPYPHRTVYNRTDEQPLEWER
ncbi:MAG: mechanosensitive ion channel family protein [Spirochaetia bacterium]